MKGIIRIEARGEQCPMPVVKAKKALDQAAAGTVIEVHIDNEIAVRNLTKLAKSQGCPITSKKLADGHYVAELTAEKGSGENLQVQEAVWTESKRSRGNFSGCMVVISSATMGTGEETLGKVLMKGFIYALSQMDELPEKIIFYHGGIMLTTKGSESLTDLKKMEDRGVEILSCGTCLDYYQRADRLQVGDVTNMYDIVEAMGKAGKIIRP